VLGSSAHVDASPIPIPRVPSPLVRVVYSVALSPGPKTTPAAPSDPRYRSNISDDDDARAAAAAAAEAFADFEQQRAQRAQQRGAEGCAVAKEDAAAVLDDPTGDLTLDDGEDGERGYVAPDADPPTAGARDGAPYGGGRARSFGPCSAVGSVSAAQARQSLVQRRKALDLRRQGHVRHAGGTSLDSVLSAPLPASPPSSSGVTGGVAESAPGGRRSAPAGGSFAAYCDGDSPCCSTHDERPPRTAEVVAAAAGGSARRPAPSRPRPRTAPLESLKFFNSPEAPPGGGGDRFGCGEATAGASAKQLPSGPALPQQLELRPARVVSPDSVIFDLGDFESATSVHR
jgi:hypothetical protein